MRPRHARLLERARRSDLTYEHVGSTLDGRGRSFVKELGRDADVFAHGIDRLRLWAPQRNLGALVAPADAPIVAGTSLLVVLRISAIEVVVPNRIVAVVDEDRRFGFAYGTLEGHHERGEESFVIDLADDGVVTFTVTVDAKPASALARLGTPIVGALQRYAISRYLDALATV